MRSGVNGNLGVSEGAPYRLSSGESSYPGTIDTADAAARAAQNFVSQPTVSQRSWTVSDQLVFLTVHAG
jgi:hypothetical protein